MKLADLATGPDWIIWTVFVVFAVLSIILLSRARKLVYFGYNMASKEEKEKYDEKEVMQNNGNWNVYYSNSYINYGFVLKTFFLHFYIYCSGNHCG